MKLKIIILLILLQCVHCFNYSANQNQEKNSFEKLDYTKKNGKSITIVLADTISKQEAVAMVKDFYHAYMTNVATADLSNLHITEKRLEEKYFTKRLIEKNRRMVSSTGADPVIRAQDFMESIIPSLDVEYLGDGWCMVSYIAGEKIKIPLKVIRSNGQIMIDYITPVWNDDAYGDSILCDHLKTLEIDFSNPLSFLKSFYDIYTLKYGSMPVDLTDQLAKLRAEYLTANALDQFEHAFTEQELDGWIGYDLLIDNFDFDCMQRSSVKITQLTDNTYQMSYTIDDSVYPINLKVVKKDNRYWIDSIEIGKKMK